MIIDNFYNVPKITDTYKRGDNLFVIFNAVQNPCLVKGGKGNQQLFTAQKTSAFCAHSCKHYNYKEASLQLQAETEITEEDVLLSANTARESEHIEAVVVCKPTAGWRSAPA